MDRTLANLYTAWWVSGDKDAARVLADRLQQIPAEDVAEVLMEFRVMTQAPQMAEAFRQIGQTMTGAFQAIAQALGNATAGPPAIPTEETPRPPRRRRGRGGV